MNARLAAAVIPLLLCAGQAPPPRFTDITASSGAGGVWDVCGIGAADIDNDGYIDICTSAVNGGSTRVYRNNGNGTFSDVANSGIGGESQAVTFGDVDNDGLVDVWVGWYWTNSRMFKGTGGLNPPFSEITGSSGTGTGQTWEGGAFADVNNDGNLDLFVTRNGGNRLYIGNGAGQFTDQAAARGVVATDSRAFAFGDVDGDGDQDLIVGILTECHLFVNDGSGFFTDATAAAGLSGIVATGASLQVAHFGDIDNDGDLDLYVAGWGFAWLLRNNGAGQFTDISAAAGIAPPAGTTPYTGSFGCAFGDYDNDGFLDLFVGGGEIGGGNIQNLLFHNNGNSTFSQVAATEGAADSAVTHVGAVFFDLENDGDLDLFVGRNPNLVLRNETNNSAWLKARVQGTLSNRSGIGTKIWVYDAGQLNNPAFLRGFREVSAGSGQASCPPAEQHFGVPAAGSYDVRVRFPSGSIVDLLNRTAAQILSVTEPVTPAVTGVSSVAANGSYGVGAPISVTVTFNVPVIVTGVPTLTLETGGVDAVAPYATGSGSRTLAFAYTVAAGHASADLDYVSASALALAGGTIKNWSGPDAVLTLPTPGAAGSLGANRNLVIDGTVPGVSGVTSLEPDGTYLAGSVLNLQVTFSENVIVTGSPRLTLETGSTDAVVPYTAGSGTPTLTFAYTVGASHASLDLDYVLSAALALNGGTIRDGAANNAILTLPAPGAAGSLGDNRNLALPGPPPTVTDVTSPNGNFTYIGGDSISVTVTFSALVAVTGTPELILETGAIDAIIPYTAGSGTNVLTFTYLVGSQDASPDLDYASTVALNLAGGTIQSLTGAAATLTLPAPGGPSSLGMNKNIVVNGAAVGLSTGGGCGLTGLEVLVLLAVLRRRRR